MEFVNNNSLLQPRDFPIFNADNRALRYGDGLFESIRMFEGYLPFFDRHMERLRRGMQQLGFAIPDDYSNPFFLLEIRKLVGFSANARIRVQVYRSANGLYYPQSDEPAFLIAAEPLEQDKFELNEEGLTVDVYQDVRLSCDHLSNLKTTNCLPYILAAIYARKNELGDVLLLNSAGRIAEASSSNIFIYKDGQLYTPSLDEGCVAGVLRAALLRLASRIGIPAQEEEISPALLESAEEIFLTNSIQGIKWVKKYKNSTFGCTLAKELTALLNQNIYE